MIAMSSITYAMKAEGFLRQTGISARVIKLPGGRTVKGCTYGLELSCTALNLALLRLEEAGIRHGETFR